MSADAIAWRMTIPCPGSGRQGPHDGVCPDCSSYVGNNLLGHLHTHDKYELVAPDTEGSGT